ncbi:unnamed protein product [Pelagomonas calceolata]|uniref:Uncharacterized protein n=1 Tax=Pelagomonas calceolata TaxID=35677 RepID=A0A8J2SID4_9STRA|nr:unnamed protein product [Pelagomonas calceolata]
MLTVRSEGGGVGACGTGGRLLAGGAGEDALELAVHDEHERRADRAQRVRAGAFEERADALLGGDLAEAVHGALVDPLLLGLLRLHLQAAAHRVEGVAGVRGAERRRLRARELGSDAHEALVLLVGINAHERVVDAEVRAAERHDAHHRDAEAVVEAERAGGPRGRLREAVDEAVELGLARADVAGQARPRVVERVDDRQRAGAREAAAGDVHGEGLAEIRLGRVLGEEALDRVLEGEVEGLRREVAQHVDEVASPKRLDALLGRDAREAVHDARVARHLAGDDLGVGVLRLDDELDALDRRRARLGDGARDAARQEVGDEGAAHGVRSLSGLRGRSRAAGCRLVESRGGGAHASRTNDVRRGVVSTGRRRSTHAIFKRMTSHAALDPRSGGTGEEADFGFFMRRLLSDPVDGEKR